MRYYRLVCLVIVAAALFAMPAFSQENQVIPAAMTEGSSAAKETSIYGEVQSVNAQTNTISVQYYDYDSDEEKIIDIVSGKDTKIENAAGVGEINKGDWVDVAFEAIDGRNMAKSIMVEKEEAGAAEPMPENIPMPQGVEQ